MSDLTYEITSERQLSLLSSMLFIHGVLIFLYLRYYGFPGDVTLLIGYLVFFMFDGLPVIILHLQYLSANRGAVLVVREEQRTLSYTQNGVHLNYSFDDIEQIIYAVGYGNGAWYSFSDYRYFVLVFKDGKKILITSLMIKYNKKRVEGMFGMKVKDKSSLYPWIRK